MPKYNCSLFLGEQKKETEMITKRLFELKEKAFNINYTLTLDYLDMHHNKMISTEELIKELQKIVKGYK